MTTDEMVSAVYTLWGEAAANSAVSPAEIALMLNRGQRRLCLIGQISMTCHTASTVIGQEVYEVPGDHIKVEFINIVDRIIPGGPSMIPMNPSDRDPTRTQGLPTHYYSWGGKSATTGLNVMSVGMQPVPSAIEDYKVYLRQSPVKMVHSSEGAMINSELKESWQDAMVDFALMEIYKRLGPDFYGLYQDQAQKWKNWEIEAKNYTNPMTNDRPIARKDTMGYGYEYGG